MTSNPSSHPPFHPSPGRPRVMPPPGSCDTHFHVFGPGPGQTADPASAYAPKAAPMEALLAMHKALGIERGVLIQNTAVKVDYPALIEELRANPQWRGVAVMNDATTDAELTALHAAGVRGVRFHFAAFLKKRPSLATFNRSIERVAALGWHVLVHCTGTELIELAPEFVKVKIPLIIDHIAHMDIALGIEQPAFKTLLELHRHDHVWVKVANGDRWSVIGQPSYADAVPFGRALVANAPERLLWGTDWPHVMYKKPNEGGDPPPDDADLLNLLYDMVPDAATVKRILVDNPARLYPFGLPA